MTAPAPSATVPRPVRRSHAGGVVLLIIGAVLIVAGPMLGLAVGSVATVPTALGVASDVVRVQPKATVTMTSGQRLYLLAPVDRLAEIEHGDCVATGSRGDASVEFAPASELNTLVNGSTYESFAVVTAPSAGRYAISCDATPPVVAAPPFELADVFGPLLWFGIGGVLVGLGGVVMLIVGIVRVAAGRAER